MLKATIPGYFSLGLRHLTAQLKAQITNAIVKLMMFQAFWVTLLWEGRTATGGIAVI